MPDVTVEFYGIPRQRAGRAQVTVPADTAREALAAAATVCSGLQDVLCDGKLAPYYRLSLNGQRFVAELNERLPPGARLLLLSADAGG